MLGTFQQSNLRIEVQANTVHIHDSLTRPSNFRQWLWPQQFQTGLPDTLATGLTFSSYWGPLEIQHQVTQVSDHSLYMLLCGGIDGCHEWNWGDNWVQSQLEGISMLPLNLGQSLVLFRLKQFLASPHPMPANSL
jgi:hypothetical protein